jgi:hypothetical protein
MHRYALVGACEAIFFKQSRVIAPEKSADGEIANLIVMLSRFPSF